MTERPSIRCPNCRCEGEWDGNPWRPFCSQRCQIIDLGAWAGEQYRIAGASAIPVDSPESGGESQEDSE
ncbi:MAG: DNA gyrase inhibitor YacG [Nitrospira sp.]|nr:DNA gyrase inhibitor YacG [Nitrospira sp.]